MDHKSLPEALSELEATLDGLQIGQVLRAGGREAVKQLTPATAVEQLQAIIMAMVHEGMEDDSDWQIVDRIKQGIENQIRKRVTKACEELVRTL